MISNRMFDYATSTAAKNIAFKNKAPVYFHEFGYSGEYSNLVESKVYSRDSGKYDVPYFMS